MKKMKFIWGEIAEDIIPDSNNRKAALKTIVRQELLSMPSLSRQIFNPGMGQVGIFIIGFTKAAAASITA